MVLPSLLLVSLGLGAISSLGTEQIVAKGERAPRYANLAKRAEAETLPHVSHAQGVETLFFSQKLDHFDASSTTVFSQRYYVNTQYYADGGPIFVYIGGEGAMGAGSVSSGEIVANAKIHSGAVIGLEHRYYGVSHPFSTLTTANLRWLSSQQALADLSNWIDFMRGDRGWKNNKIFTFGGSYPGALSAWFRLKYPNVTEGSVASSAPVLAMADYYQYDQTVAAGVGAQCADQIRKGNALIESLLASQPDQIKARFGCEAVKDPVGFLYVLADAVAYAIQYTSERAGPRYHLREMLCDHMAGADPVEGYIAFFNQLMGLLKTTCPDFTTTDDTLADVTVAEGLAQRQWYYQSCMEFGYFQTAPRVKPLRSSKIDLGFHIELCKRAFGPSVAGPDVEKTNAYYGGNHTKSSKIYFPNGSVDPWHVLSVQYPLSCCPTIVPLIINGTSHCADLYEATSADPASLVAARADITRKISDWLA